MSGNLGGPLGAIRAGGYDTSVPVVDPLGLALAVDEVQRVVSGGVIASYTLTFDGQTTGTIAGTVNAAAVQAALEALSNLAPGDVAVTGGPLNSADLVITFGGAYAGVNVPQITVAPTGAPGTPTATTATAGSAAPGLRLDAALGTIALEGTITSLTITERMGAADSVSVTLTDVPGDLDLATLTAGLCDFHIADATEHLFRGQITTTTVATTWGETRDISISAEGYERLIRGCPVCFPPVDMFLVQPDGTQVNTYGYTTGGGTDKDNVTGLFKMWWNDRDYGPLVDAETMVIETTANPMALFAPLDRVMLDGALGIVAEITGAAPHLVSWLDAALQVHWTDGADSTKCDPAPFEIDADRFDTGVVMAMTMSVTKEAGGIMGGAIVTGALPWVGGPWSIHAWAPYGTISSDRAITVGEGATFFGRYAAEVYWPKVSGKATIPAGWDGWHKGQWVIVTDLANGLDHYGCLIQGVTRRLLSEITDPPEFEYDLEFGDAPPRSLGRESAIPMQGFAPVTSTSYTVTSDDPNPTPTKPANLKAQLQDFKGAPLGTKGITGVWHLDINGTRVADPTDSGQSFWLDSATGTTDETGAVFNVEHVSATAGLDYADPFFETVQP
jgi:hypothetical protein